MKFSYENRCAERRSTNPLGAESIVSLCTPLEPVAGCVPTGVAVCNANTKIYPQPHENAASCFIKSFRRQKNVGQKNDCGLLPPAMVNGLALCLGKSTGSSKIFYSFCTDFAGASAASQAQSLSVNA